VSRRVLVFNSTWQDKRFKKTFAKLSPKDQDDLLLRLSGLAAALAATQHPILDPVLKQRFRPGAYDGVVSLRGAKLVEYRLGGLIRVIAKYPARQGSDDILLLAITLEHDHDRLKSLLRQHKSAIQGWQEEEENRED
jgi:hypothetical protein